MKSILGKYTVSYKILNTTYTDYLNIITTSLDKKFGYMAIGTYGKYNSSKTFGCTYDNKEFSGFNYVCVGNSTLGKNYNSWYYIDVNSNSINGRYYIGNSEKAVYARLLGKDYVMVGSKIENYTSEIESTSSATSNTNNSEFITDLKGKSHNIGWYFWMSDSGKAYLASGRDTSTGMAVWNLTSDRKWRPVHNAPAFDGYPKADGVFNNVYLSSDGKQIIIN